LHTYRFLLLTEGNFEEEINYALLSETGDIGKNKKEFGI